MTPDPLTDLRSGIDDLRERLATALHEGGWVKDPTGCQQSVSGVDQLTGVPWTRRPTWDECQWTDEHSEMAGALIADLGGDAPRLAAALGEGAVVTTVERVARRMYESEHSDDCGCDMKYPEVWGGYLAEARRLLGLPEVEG